MIKSRWSLIILWCIVYIRIYINISDYVWVTFVLNCLFSISDFLFVSMYELFSLNYATLIYLTMHRSINPFSSNPATQIPLTSNPPYAYSVYNCVSRDVDNSINRIFQLCHIIIPESFIAISTTLLWIDSLNSWAFCFWQKTFAFGWCFDHYSLQCYSFQNVD